MKTGFTRGAWAIALQILPVAAHAAGMDVVRQSYDVLFEPGTVLQSTLTSVNPHMEGSMWGIPTGNVGPAYWTGAIGLKTDINDDVSLAVILDRPYYNEVSFPAALGSVYGRYSADELTGLMRYRFADNWSVIGGIRVARFEGVTTATAAPMTDFRLDGGYGVGFAGGLAYESDDQGTLARLMYKSPIKFSLDGEGSVFGLPGTLDGTYHVELPQSVMFDLRVPAGEKSFLFGSATWNDWSATQVTLYQNLGSDTTATNFDDNWLLSIGGGHFLTDDFILSGSFTYDTGTRKVAGYDTIYKDQKTFAVGMTYLQEHYRLTGAVGYTIFGDTKGVNASLGGAPASFENNSTLSFQLQATYKF